MIDTWVSKNFKRSELACPCCKQMKCKIGLIDCIQSIRDYLDMPIIITSAYRCKMHNSTIPGSSPESYHTKGLAVDISTLGWCGYAIHDLLELITSQDSGIGVYPTFIHFDLRNDRSVWIG